MAPVLACFIALLFTCRRAVCFIDDLMIDGNQSSAILDNLETGEFDYSSASATHLPLPLPLPLPHIYDNNLDFLKSSKNWWDGRRAKRSAEDLTVETIMKTENATDEQRDTSKTIFKQFLQCSKHNVPDYFTPYYRANTFKKQADINTVLEYVRQATLALYQLRKNRTIAQAMAISWKPLPSTPTATHDILVEFMYTYPTVESNNDITTPTTATTHFSKPTRKSHQFTQPTTTKKTTTADATTTTTKTTPPQNECECVCDNNITQPTTLGTENPICQKNLLTNRHKYKAFIFENLSNAIEKMLDDIILYARPNTIKQTSITRNNRNTTPITTTTTTTATTSTSTSTDTSTDTSTSTSISTSTSTSTARTTTGAPSNHRPSRLSASSKTTRDINRELIAILKYLDLLKYFPEINQIYFKDANRNISKTEQTGKTGPKRFFNGTAANQQQQLIEQLNEQRYLNRNTKAMNIENFKTEQPPEEMTTRVPITTYFQQIDRFEEDRINHPSNKLHKTSKIDQFKNDKSPFRRNILETQSEARNINTNTKNLLMLKTLKNKYSLPFFKAMASKINPMKRTNNNNNLMNTSRTPGILTEHAYKDQQHSLVFQNTKELDEQSRLGHTKIAKSIKEHLQKLQNSFQQTAGKQIQSTIAATTEQPTTTNPGYIEIEGEAIDKSDNNLFDAVPDEDSPAEPAYDEFEDHADYTDLFTGKYANMLIDPKLLNEKKTKHQEDHTNHHTNPYNAIVFEDSGYFDGNELDRYDQHFKR